MNIRKATKQQIRETLVRYSEWRARVDARASKIGPNAAYVLEWADDVRERIEQGECRSGHACTQALIRSVERDLESWESGYYRGIDKSGARMIA